MTRTMLWAVAEIYNSRLCDSDTRRKAETPKSGSVRSTGSAGPKGIAQ